ncbi:MAG TPA: LysR family transcriptional regulator [Burkholderiales bacterium]
MTLEDLRVFVAACEAGSLSALARQLGRTQSAVSQHIARLETELGVTLLERQARGVEPTAAGRILRDLALEGLDAIEVALKRIRALRDGETGSLTITTGGTTVRHFLRDTVVRFRREHPAVNLRFIPANSTRRCFEILRLSQADLAFVTTGDPVRGISELTVARQHFFLLVSKDDPLARRRRVQLKDLKGIRYLGLSEGTTHRGALEQAAAERGVHLEPEIVFDDFDTANIFVELNLGHAIVPAVHAHHFAKSGAVKAVLIADLPPVPVGWAFRHWNHLSAPARDFVELFRLELKRMRNVPGVEIV